MLRTLSSKNNASAGEKVRVVAGWVIEHVKHEFFGFDATKEPPPSVRTEPVVFLVREWKDGVLFDTLLPIYLSVGELTEGW